MAKELISFLGTGCKYKKEQSKNISSPASVYSRYDLNFAVETYRRFEFGEV